MITGIACSGTSNASKGSNQDTRKRAQSAYSKLDDDYAGNATVKNKNFAGKTSTQNQTSIADMPKPVIMVTPVPSDQNSKATMEGVTEYLAKKGYEVKSPEGSSNLDNLIQMQNDIAGTEDDQNYLASLSLSADIYVKYSGTLNSNGQVTVELHAYETSTARLLGSHSSFVNSHGRTSPLDMKANLKTAAHKAMSGLEANLLSYWKDDLKQGVQYKVVMNIKGDYGDSQLEDLHESIIANLKAAFNKVKVNSMTSQTIDVVVYADPEKMDDAQSAYSEIRKLLKNLAETKKISVTKKLIIMDIK